MGMDSRMRSTTSIPVISETKDNATWLLTAASARGAYRSPRARTGKAEQAAQCIGTYRHRPAHQLRNANTRGNGALGVEPGLGLGWVRQDRTRGEQGEKDFGLRDARTGFAGWALEHPAGGLRDTRTPVNAMCAPHHRVRVRVHAARAHKYAHSGA
ncbi:hypothetical protein EVG20_g8182 [Dentipellis fragilis]|uniref:Uncharacterized protein n=1 Tax=Dentipellis fragilis TaxID=205917 RepID=A0A4Y9Y857_9AGAM|nr:hypothetical protein EVG20_g8182 [Dentipellis fragilis]